MKKLSSIILILFCIFSFNTCFQVNPILAKEEPLPELPLDVELNEQSDDILDQPVFQDENKKIENKGAKHRLSSIFIKILGGFLLLLVVIICGSFIWIANLQRQREKRRKKQSANANVINAVDNFARRKLK